MMRVSCHRMLVSACILFWADSTHGAPVCNAGSTGPDGQPCVPAQMCIDPALFMPDNPIHCDTINENEETMKYHCDCAAYSAEECAEKYPGEQPRSMQRMPRQALTLRQPCKPESLASPRHTHVCDHVGRLPSCSDPAHLAGAMISAPTPCKGEVFVHTCEEPSHAEFVDRFASKCCGNGLSRCYRVQYTLQQRIGPDGPITVPSDSKYVTKLQMTCRTPSRNS